MFVRGLRLSCGFSGLGVELCFLDLWGEVLILCLEMGLLRR